jgi:Toprim domain-containing protein
MTQPQQRPARVAVDVKFLARALGGDIIGRDQVAAPGPGHSRKDRSLSVRLSAAAPEGFLTHSYAGDDWRTCRDHVKRALGLPAGRSAEPRAAPAPVVIHFHAPDPDKLGRALTVWRGSVNPRGTPVETYLRSRRLELDAPVAGEVLRWHPRLKAMVALFRNIVTDEPQAVSRTFLNREAQKTGRMFIGPVGGAAIKLDADEEVLGGLHIGEGIETCLASRMMGLRPAWALGSAGAIAAFPVLNGVECLTLLREHDEANKRASNACATRWAKASREVFNILPRAGNDVNDSLMGVA